ncbi:MAG: NAD(P)/FAD-dependent oxidoreductase [Rhodopila sp.]
MPKLPGGHAVVVGAGIAGLAAAQAASGYFDKITVLDRDMLPQGPEPRAGTPQARHGHALLGAGQASLAKLFPDFAKEIESAGAVKARSGFDIWMERPGFDPFPVRDLGFDSYCLSRPLLEFVIRRCLERKSKVSLHQRCRVTELLASSNGAAVVGLRFEDANGLAQTLMADLIIDASGRGTLTLDLLARAGCSTPQETEIGIDIGYATAVFEVPKDRPGPWKGLMHLGMPPDCGRGGLILPMENNQWMVSLGGVHGDVPPGDIDGYMRFAQSLRTPTIYKAIRSARRVRDVARYGFPSSIRRHFEHLPAFPDGVIPIGDAICRFNPVFGQGMSVAAQEACALRDLLNERTEMPDPLKGLASAFFTRIQPLLDAPWRTAENDFAFPQTRGERPADFERRLQYGAALLRIAAEDPTVHRLMAEVNGLLKPPGVLREPALAERVMALMKAAAAPCRPENC